MKLLIKLLFGRHAGRAPRRKKKPSILLRLLDTVCSIPLKALEGKWNTKLWDPRS